MTLNASSEPALFVSVDGGQLAVHDLSGVPTQDDAATVLFVHGITANALTWEPIAAQLRDRHEPGTVRFLAVDLRGRACSRHVGPPYGIDVDAADVHAVIEQITTRGLIQDSQVPLLVGHSMGAFVAVAAAQQAGGRLAGLVLVDGGLAFPTPAGVDVDTALRMMLGPSLQRISMTFADTQDYLTFMVKHPAMGPLLSATHGRAVRDYLLHDLIAGSAGSARPDDTLVSACVVDAIRADGAGLLQADASKPVLAELATGGLGIDFLWAPRGLMDEPQGLYDEQRVAGHGLPPQVTVHFVPDTNHFSILLGESGAKAVADVIEQRLGLAGA